MEKLEEKVSSLKILIVLYVKTKNYLKNTLLLLFQRLITNSRRLNSAVWSGGSFIYVPKNVKLDTPLQAY